MIVTTFEFYVLDLQELIDHESTTNTTNASRYSIPRFTFDYILLIVFPLLLLLLRFNNYIYMDACLSPFACREKKITMLFDSHSDV